MCHKALDGGYCGALLDSRDIHLRTCRMNSINHEKHEALKFWFQDLTKQAHIQTAPAPSISEVSARNPTKQLAGDLMILVDVSFFVSWGRRHGNAKQLTVASYVT